MGQLGGIVGPPRGLPPAPLPARGAALTDILCSWMSAGACERLRASRFPREEPEHPKGCEAESPPVCWPVMLTMNRSNSSSCRAIIWFTVSSSGTSSSS